MNISSLSFSNVLVAYSFLMVSVVTSLLLNIGLSGKILLSSLRCVIQLTIMGYLLKPIMDNYNLPLMVLLTLAMISMGAIEVSFLKLKKTIRGMFWISIFAISVGCTTIAILGNAFAIGVSPFYNPRFFLPVIGMLLGNAITGTALCLTSLFDGLYGQQDVIEFYLALGATKWQAMRPLIAKSLAIGLLPNLNSMSIQGFISIPGMMTGQILAGMAPLDAVKYQQILMFLISAATCLTVVVCTLVVYWTMFDEREQLNLSMIHDNEWTLFPRRSNYERL